MISFSSKSSFLRGKCLINPGTGQNKQDHFQCACGRHQTAAKYRMGDTNPGPAEHFQFKWGDYQCISCNTDL